jgi:hypothetical protein
VLKKTYIKKIFSDPLGRDSGRDVALLAGPRRHADAADRRATQVATPHPPPDHGGPAGRGAFLRDTDWLGNSFFVVAALFLFSRVVIFCAVVVPFQLRACGAWASVLSEGFHP